MGLTRIKPLTLVEPSTVWSMPTRASIMTLFDAEDTGEVSLNVTELEFIILDVVTHRVPTGNPINTMLAQITDTCFRMIVDERDNVGHTIILWQEILVIGVVEGINV